jgi:hypothetical protein
MTKKNSRRYLNESSQVCNVITSGSAGGSKYQHVRLLGLLCFKTEFHANAQQPYNAGFKSKQHKHWTCEAKVYTVAGVVLSYLAQYGVFLQMTFETGIFLLEFKLDRSQRINTFEFYLANLRIKYVVSRSQMGYANTEVHYLFCAVGAFDVQTEYLEVQEYVSEPVTNSSTFLPHVPLYEGDNDVGDGRESACRP